jgi:hypothetical protein
MKKAVICDNAETPTPKEKLHDVVSYSVHVFEPQFEEWRLL